jgi:hypothetical protein
LPGQASSARWSAAAAPRRDRTGEGREERGRERRVGIQIKFSQNFKPELEKTLNMKVVGNLKIYNFNVSQKFI